MSKYNDTSHGTSTANLNAPAGLAGRFARYRTYRRTLTELNSLSIRERNDLGLGSENLRAIAYQAAYGS